MKQINIKCYENGKTTKIVRDLFFNSENLAATITIDYSDTTSAGWTKRCNIKMSDGTGAIFNGSTSETLVINLTNAVTKAGIISIYPYAVQMQDEAEARTVFELQLETIGDFEDLLHDDSTVTPSIAEQLQLQIDQANALIALKMELDAANSDVDILSFNIGASPAVSEGQIAYNAAQRSFVGGLGNDVEGTFFAETHYPDTINSDTVTITNGSLVQFDGSIGNSGVIKVKRCLTTVALAGAIMGIATEDIAVNQKGKITWFGKVRGIQTNGANYGETWVDGDMLYNSGTIAGGLSKVKPTAPKNAAFVGIVVNAHASSGQLLVRPMFFPKLSQLSDVYTNGGATNGQVLMYDFANTRWYNATLTAGGIANTPAGGISGVTVQSAINELDTEKADKLMATNLITNGDLSNGTTGWLSNGSTNSVLSNVLSNTGVGTSSGPYVRNDLPALVIGRKYYYRLLARVTNAVSTAIRLRVFSMDTSDTIVGTPIQNTWYQFSAIKTATSAGVATPYIAHLYADNATANGKVMEVKYVLALDLTAIFGSGKEPTAAQMDNLLANFTNSWFNGTIELAPIVNILNTKADKTQEAWITPTLLNGWANNAFRELQYFKDQFGMVHMQGLSAGALNVDIFTLPVGYRPSQTVLYFPVSSNSAFGLVTISNAGVVKLVAGSTAGTSFASVHFKAA